MIDLSGPIGGILAGAYGAGAVMGWGFAHKTIGKRVSELKDEMRDDKADCDRRIVDLSNRLREVEDRYMSGLERQTAQIRDSAIHVIRSGRIDPPL